ncbi:hypothetical protein A7D35_02785 [Xanthomonas arboricola]|uniref:hypothetical protein n=1 Tax=Xanthomonas arboricola TaxID=56448 RepID=UPI0007ECD74B|nr:hypothetical protein [Xanthomonas arboricola]OBR78757.1 hypothetical protein A7D35_02785 [Xanthomonas arboricola]
MLGMQGRPTNMQFSALRRYDTRTGVGAVVAVFFVPQQAGAERDQASDGQSNRNRVAEHPRHG